MTLNAIEYSFAYDLEKSVLRLNLQEFEENIFQL